MNLNLSFKNSIYKLWMRARGIDLGWVNIRDLAFEDQEARGHSNSGGPPLRSIFDTLPISPNDAIIDIGCGKGGAMITLASYPFYRVDGVELAPALAHTAIANLARLGITKSSVFCSDAAQFTAYDPYTFVYFYNPFGSAVMQSVVSHISESLRRNRRALTVIYKGPDYGDQFLNLGFERTREFNDVVPVVHIYRFDPEKAHARATAI